MSDSLPTSERHRVSWPKAHWVFGRVHRMLAFGFGSGLIRPGSGTWGSVAALLAWWPLSSWMPWHWLGLGLVAASMAGIWICGRTTRELGVDDHVGVVWDEIVSVWVVLWAMPPLAWAWLFGFVLFRLFDIVKPWPIRQLDQRIGGGFGVMLDDWVAALYAIGVVWASAWVYVNWMGDRGW